MASGMRKCTEKCAQMHRKMCNEFEDVFITKIILRQNKAIEIRYHNLNLIPATEKYIAGIRNAANNRQLKAQSEATHLQLSELICLVMCKDGPFPDNQKMFL